MPPSAEYTQTDAVYVLVTSINIGFSYRQPGLLRVPVGLVLAVIFPEDESVRPKDWSHKKVASVPFGLGSQPLGLGPPGLPCAVCTATASGKSRETVRPVTTIVLSTGSMRTDRPLSKPDPPRKVEYEMTGSMTSGCDRS